jgi:co-chaperonin GroES (HSP10)
MASSGIICLKPKKPMEILAVGPARAKRRTHLDVKVGDRIRQYAGTSF